MGVSGGIWLGIIQSDPQAVGQHRDYKWKRSDENVPNTWAIWANRYLPSKDQPEACGYFNTATVNSRLHDNRCTHIRQFIVNGKNTRLF